MDQRTQDFIAAFQTFLDEVVANHRERAPREDERALAPVLQKHLGADPRGIAVVTEEVPAYRFVDLDVALAEIQERDQQAQLLGRPRTASTSWNPPWPSAPAGSI